MGEGRTAGTDACHRGGVMLGRRGSRQDPFLSAPHPRELMISLWYPARGRRSSGSRYPFAPWIPPVAGPLLLAQLIPAPLVPVTLPGGGTGYQPGPPVSISLDGVGLPVTSARQGVPATPPPGGCPVVLYSPGAQVDREFGTAQAEDLASHGYIVASIDHTYEAPEVIFPGGRIAVQVNPQPSQATVLTTRIADVQFVLDSLAALAAGANPDTGHHPLPRWPAALRRVPRRHPASIGQGRGVGPDSQRHQGVQRHPRRHARRLHRPRSPRAPDQVRTAVLRRTRARLVDVGSGDGGDVHPRRLPGPGDLRADDRHDHELHRGQRLAAGGAPFAGRGMRRGPAGDGRTGPGSLREQPEITDGEWTSCKTTP